MGYARTLSNALWAGVLSAVAGALAGCSGGVMPELVQPGDTVQVPEDMVAIRFANLTIAEAVDVQFYASDGPLDDLPDDLFVPANLVTTNIGVAGTGIIQPWREDFTLLPCTPGFTIGTRGGAFLDDESGEPRGVGTARWAQDGPLGLCGSVVTFEYAGRDGEFTTALVIGG
jgi:hypothetical protein